MDIDQLNIMKLIGSSSSELASIQVGISLCVLLGGYLGIFLTNLRMRGELRQVTMH